MQHFSRAGLTFPVVDAGPAEGEVVVLLHGFPQDAASYDAVVPLLNAQGLRTLVPTQRGYAETARPQRRRDYRLAELAGDVIALIDAAGVNRMHLVGHDWGGAVAWAVAGWFPERVRTLTVLSTPHTGAMVESLLRSSQLAKSWYMGFFQLPWLPEVTLQRRFRKLFGRTGLPEATIERYAAHMTDRQRLTGALNWYRALPYSRRPEVPNILVPTTYVWGERDFALGKVAAERTAGHVTADYRFVPLDAGHWLPEGHEIEVAEAILDRVQRAG